MITPEEFLEHWQGHRRATRGVIEAFPAEEFFRFSVGGMRPFAELAMEMPGYALLLYVMDNEIHHRGQGYAYLRALGIEPPPFYDRS